MQTICAIATSLQEAAIGIVRLSGEKSLEIASKLFKGKNLKEHPRMLLYGHLYDGDVLLDEVMCVYFPAPHTYTREEMVEIHTHGGSMALQRVLEALLNHGAVLARAGEFTERAFLNGRIDLTQAEAIMDMISSKSEKAFSVSLSHLKGDTRETIIAMREKLLEVLARVALAIDYPEEDEEEISFAAIDEVISDLLKTHEKLLRNSKQGTMLEDGLKVAIFGKPNVGKSSLLNKLSRRNRAIVTDIPGTTRDTIEEKVLLHGLPVILVDTAGVRETQDVVELLGVERSKEAVEEADVILFVFDAQDEMTKEDLAPLEDYMKKDHFIVINKSDREKKIDESLFKGHRVIHTSMTTEQGLAELEERLYEESFNKDLDEETPLISNMRQLQLLKESTEALKDAKYMSDNREPYDYLEVDLKHAFDKLGEILGEKVQADLMSEVFSRFCVGK